MESRLVLLALSILPAMCVTAKTEIKDKVTYYEVKVDKPEELVSALQESTTIVRSGNTFYGQTRYSITWTYNANVNKGFCKVGKPKVTATVNMTLPKLNSQNPEVIKKWDSWFPALLAHQNQHRQHAVDTSEQLKKALKKLKRQRDCTQLFNNATTLANTMIEASLDKDIHYDEETRFGYSEGAWSVFEN